MGGKNNALDVTIDLIQVITSGLAKMSVITGAQWNRDNISQADSLLDSIDFEFPLFNEH